MSVQIEFGAVAAEVGAAPGALRSVSFRALVVGAGADLAGLLPAVGLLISHAPTLESVPAYSEVSLDLILLDALAVDAAAWREIAKTSGLEDAPVLLVERPKSGDAQDGPEAYGALESVARPIEAGELGRRMRLLAELGRLRRKSLELEGPVLELFPAEGARTDAFFSRVLEELPTGVVTADAAHRVTFMNRAAYATLGLTDPSPIGAPLAEVMKLPLAGPDCKMGGRAAYAFRRPDGREIELGISVTSTREVHPSIRWFVLFRDLTSGRETELTARRVERLAAIGTMVTGFAHEVRNPVSAMRLMIDTLDEETPAPDPRRSTLAKLVRHIERIERLIKTSLRFGRPEEPRKERVAPVILVDEAIEQLRPRTRDLGEIRRHVAPDLPELWVDAEQLVQVLIALLNNALDAAGYVDQVLIAASHYGDANGESGVCLEVRDNGSGIPEQIMSRIFDPFFTTKPGGTGLGLSIAQRLVHDNGGRIEASSQPGLGASFRVRVPTSARGAP